MTSKTDAAAEAPTGAPTGGPPGSLSLATEPSSKVFLGGQSLGTTPLSKVSLPSGHHVLKLVGDDGKELPLPVDIKPGENKVLRIPLEMLSQQ